VLFEKLTDSVSVRVTTAGKRTKFLKELVPTAGRIDKNDAPHCIDVIEALVRGGDVELARAEVERLSKIVGNNNRYHLILLRLQAVLAQWDGDVAQAIVHLQAALALAREMGLPGEEWPILGALGGLYAELGEEGKAQQAYQEAAVIIHRLAETIDEEDLRVGYLTAVCVQSILEKSEGV